MVAAYTIGWATWVFSFCCILSLFDSEDDKKTQQNNNNNNNTVDITKWSKAILAGTTLCAGIPLCIGLETMSRRMMLSPLTGTSTQYNGSLLNTFKIMHQMGPNNLSRITPLLSGWIAAFIFDTIL
eukprot:UN02718